MISTSFQVMAPGLAQVSLSGLLVLHALLGSQRHWFTCSWCPKPGSNLLQGGSAAEALARSLQCSYWEHILTGAHPVGSPGVFSLRREASVLLGAALPGSLVGSKGGFFPRKSSVWLTSKQVCCRLVPAAGSSSCSSGFSGERLFYSFPRIQGDNVKGSWGFQKFS